MPALTFLATATSMVLAVGAAPAVVDVESQTRLIDLADAERRITPRTHGIITVHFFGNPCDPKVVGDFAQRHGLTIVWDAAQAHGATINGLDVGAFDGTVCYLLYATKNLFVGEGGIICTSSESMAEHMRRLRQHGRHYPTLRRTNAVLLEQCSLIAVSGNLDQSRIEQP